MPRGSSREFRTKYDGAAAALGLGGTANRLVDSGFIAKARGSFKEQGFAVDGGNSSRIFQSNADLAASELGLAPGQTQSLDFGPGLQTQALSNNTHTALGIGDVWSWGFWYKPIVPFVNLQRMVRLAPASSNNDFVNLAHDNVSDRLLVDLIDEDNSTNGTMAGIWNSFFTGLNGVWTHYLIVFIGGNPAQLFALKNGVDQSPTSISFGGSQAPNFHQSDRARRVDDIGNDATTRSIGGILMQAQLWRVDVRAAASFLANAANAAVRDLNVDSGAYTFSADLAHWWKPGDEAEPNLGKDFSTAGFTPTIDIGVNKVNLTNSDRVADVPF